MQRKIIWLILSCLIVATMVLASCAPQSTTTPTGAATPPAGGTTTPYTGGTATPVNATTTPVAGPQMVKVTLKKLDGAIVEKMMEKPKYGGTITTAYDLGDPASFDPLDQQTTTNTIFAPFVYEKLQIGDYTRSPNGTNEFAFTHWLYIPGEMRTGCLAESWEQPDSQTVIWHIRKGIRWQNIAPVSGRELNADDVVYSIKRQATSPRASETYHGMWESVEAKDKYTVVVKLKWPDYTYVAKVGDAHVVPIYPREMVEKYGNLNKPESSCGTGPWILKDYVRGSVITYRKNPDYWMKDPFFPENSLPYASSAKVLFIPDTSTRISALRTGKVDVLIQNRYWQDAETLKKTNPEIRQLPYVAASSILGISIRVDKPPFNDIRVRQAVTIAIDQNALLKDYLSGHGELHGYPMMREWGEGVYTPIDKLPTEPTITGSKASVKELVSSYNPEKAKQLLAEAGYPGGFKTDVILISSDADVTSMVAAYWKKIGVDLELHVKDPAVLASLTSAIPRTYPEGMVVEKVSAVDREGGLSQFWTNGFRNRGNVSDPLIDKYRFDLIAEPDAAKRDKMTKDVSLHVLEEAYTIGGPVPYEYNFWQPWLKNSEGAAYLTKWGLANAFAFYWVDQDLKEQMTGKR